jgi:hypothetical protein
MVVLGALTLFLLGFSIFLVRVHGDAHSLCVQDDLLSFLLENNIAIRNVVFVAT